MSGISVSDELLALYNSVKLDQKHKYVIFSLAPVDAAKKTYDWQIDEAADPEPDFDKNEEKFAEAVSKLPDDKHKFLLFDFKFSSADGRRMEKLILVKWCPDSEHFRVKPIVGATYQTLKERLPGLAKDMQATDADELAYEIVLKTLSA
eukprot:TRINITY_DN22048_c0_g2_i1.p2 TRINITY_DN22048_c0_g2~~TRINITY_DN22048_c0_g2_i1.p2  ORF type:complete len:149 (-),score=57.21 TRINITY_DN22048_c0_g2_i1:138-584(-)